MQKLLYILIVGLFLISGCTQQAITGEITKEAEATTEDADLSYDIPEEQATHCGKHFPAGTPKPPKEEDHEHKEVDCPTGVHNDPYPGDCVLYVDNDNNGYCDLSQ